MLDEVMTRTARLIGWENVAKLSACRVAVFGLGGVGGSAAEALARAGIGTLDVFDHDRVALSNLNRQIIATMDTVGQYKADAMRTRLLNIRPDMTVHVHRLFFLPDRAEEVDFSVYDYIVDAIDTVSAKIGLVLSAKAAGVNIISCMGTGNKLDPTLLMVDDITRTSVCPLARVIRKELKVRGVDSLRVVYSKEPPRTPIDTMKTVSGETVREPACAMPANPANGLPHENPSPRVKIAPGSISFVPPVAGMMMAGEVVRGLLGL